MLVRLVWELSWVVQFLHSMVLPTLPPGLLSDTVPYCWLVAKEALLQAAAMYLIVSSLPDAMAAIIGTFFFKEV